jgi:hypothetical protein
LKVLDTFKNNSLENLNEIIKLTYKISNVYVKEKNYNKALTILEYCNENYCNEKNLDRVMIKYNISVCYLKLEMYEKNRDMCETLYGEMIQYKGKEHFYCLKIEFYLIIAYFNLKEYHLVTDYVDDLIKRYNIKNKKGDIFILKFYKAVSYFHLQDYKISLNLMNELEKDMFKKYGKDNEFYINLIIYLIYCNLNVNNIEKALEMNNEFFDLIKKKKGLDKLLYVQEKIIKVLKIIKDLQNEYYVIGKYMAIYKEKYGTDNKIYTELAYRTGFIYETVFIGDYGDVYDLYRLLIK